MITTFTLFYSRSLLYNHYFLRLRGGIIAKTDGAMKKPWPDKPSGSATVGLGLLLRLSCHLVTKMCKSLHIGLGLGLHGCPGSLHWNKFQDNITQISDPPYKTGQTTHPAIGSQN